MTWIDGDASAIPASVTVDAVTMTANVAQVFLTDADWLATLGAARGRSKSGTPSARARSSAPAG